MSKKLAVESYLEARVRGGWGWLRDWEDGHDLPEDSKYPHLTGMYAGIIDDIISAIPFTASELLMLIERRREALTGGQSA